jgi:carbon storage regulator
MPVITRKEGESFMVSDDIVITVVEARPGLVRIGIEAPLAFRVRRRQE